jgi:glycerophosphoryl diester phosphodiesterase
MKNHEDNLIGLVSGVLTPLLGVSITVTNNSTGNPASLYSDNGVTPLTQPLVTDNTGHFSFYAANGEYSLSFTGAQIAPFTRQIELYDPNDAEPLTQAQAAASSGSSLIGHGGESVGNALNALQLPDYAALRAYTGLRQSVYVTGYLGSAAPSGIAGMFVRDDHDTTTADNGFSVIVGANNIRWKRGELSPSASAAQTGLTQPGYGIFCISHRGSAALYPENTDVAFANSMGDGNTWLEMDVQTLSDGTLAVMHDSTIDRTTTGTGTVASQTAATWAALQIDGDAVNGTNYGNALAAPTFQAVLDKYAGRAVLVPEDKDGFSMAAMLLALRKAGVKPRQCLIQISGLAGAAAPLAAGYDVLYISAGSDTPASILAAGVKWVGVSLAATDAQIQGFVAAGLKTLAWTVQRRCDRDRALALGCIGVFADDPTYAKNNSPLRTTDNFVQQTWSPGMFASTGTNRGKFLGGTKWGFDVVNVGYLSCLQGYLCPIKGQQSPSSYTIVFKIKYVTANAGDITRWGSCFIGDTDVAYTDNPSDLVNGYHLLYRKNGTLQIWKKVSGQATVMLVQQTGTTIADGTEIGIAITVTPTTIKLARTDLSGVEQYSVTASDTSSRGGYLTVGESGLSCEYRDLSVV